MQILTLKISNIYSRYKTYICTFQYTNIFHCYVYIILPSISLSIQLNYNNLYALHLYPYISQVNHIKLLQSNSFSTFNLQIILATICSAAIAEPGYVRSVIPYSYLEVLDTPEVAQAKAAHLATQAYEAARNTLGYAHVPALIHVYTPVSGAPLGADGNVIDTPEVAEAKAAHLTAHALVIASRGLEIY